MSEMILKYELSPEFRNRHFLETGIELEALAEVALDPTALTQAQRAGLLAMRAILTRLGDLKRPEVTESGTVRDARLISDHILTTDEAAAIVEAYSAARAKAEKLATERKAAIEEKDRAVKAERERQYAEQQAREEARKAKEKAEAEKRDTDKRAWVATHGSDGLKARIEAGYDCQRMYVTERAAMELPGFVIDWKDRADWKARSCPSDTGFAIERGLVAQGFSSDDVGVVWLTDSPEEPGDPYGDDFEPREAVHVTRYLGRYDAFRFDY